MDARLGTRTKTFYWAAASALLMVLGGFAPWATALGVVSVAGTEGDGWLLIAGGVIAFVLLVRHSAGTRRWPMVTAAVVGALGALIALYDLSNLNDLAGESPMGGLIDPAWGLYVSLLASLSLAVASVVALRERRSAETAAVA